MGENKEESIQKGVVIRVNGNNSLKVRIGEKKTHVLAFQGLSYSLFSVNEQVTIITKQEGNKEIVEITSDDVPEKRTRIEMEIPNYIEREEESIPETQKDIFFERRERTRPKTQRDILLEKLQSKGIKGTVRFPQSNYSENDKWEIEKNNQYHSGFNENIYGMRGDTIYSTKLEEYKKIAENYGFKKIVDGKDNKIQVYRDNKTGLVLIITLGEESFIQEAQITGEQWCFVESTDSTGNMDELEPKSVWQDVKIGFKYQLDRLFEKIVFNPNWMLVHKSIPEELMQQIEAAIESNQIGENQATSIAKFTKAFAKGTEDSPSIITESDVQAARNNEIKSKTKNDQEKNIK